MTSPTANPPDTRSPAAVRRHSLCRRDPLPTLYRRAARLVAGWREEFDCLILGEDGAVRPTRLEEIPGAGIVMVIDLTDEPRVVWEVARGLGLARDRGK